VHGPCFACSQISVALPMIFNSIRRGGIRRRILIERKYGETVESAHG
jgi:hypothetical protein